MLLSTQERLNCGPRLGRLPRYHLGGDSVCGWYKASAEEKRASRPFRQEKGNLLEGKERVTGS